MRVKQQPAFTPGSLQIPPNRFDPRSREHLGALQGFASSGWPLKKRRSRGSAPQLEGRGLSWKSHFKMGLAHRFMPARANCRPCQSKNLAGGSRRRAFSFVASVFWNISPLKGRCTPPSQPPKIALKPASDFGPHGTDPWLVDSHLHPIQVLLPTLPDFC